MKKLFRPYLAIFLISSLVATVTSCGNDDNPPPANEEEVITSVKLELVPNAGAPKGVNRVEATYRDLDGDGGNPPTVETLTLAPNVTYSAKLTFLDESKTPAKDITTEIREEADDHQIFYDKLPTKDDKTLGENLVVSDLDKDNKGLPLGLQAKIATVNSNTGILRVTLRHQPGQKTGNENTDKTAGEVDVVADFPVIIQ